MALFTPSASPAVTVKEIDLTGGVPNVQTSTGAFVGNFGWGPVGEVKLVSNEQGLVSTFSAPTTDNTVDFHSAAYFLRYSNTLNVVREANDSSAKNAVAANTYGGAGGLTADSAAQKIDNLDAFEAISLNDSDGVFIAKYPGKLGNSIQVSVCVQDSAGASTFSDWAFKGSFDRAPGTSDFASAREAKNDEIHIAVVDRDGKISGTVGTVLETFSHVSVGTNAKNTDGTSNYYKDLVKIQSKWVYATGRWNTGDSAGSSDVDGAYWDTEILAGDSGDARQNFAVQPGRDSGSQHTWSLGGGANSTTLSAGDIARGFDKFEDKANVEIDFLIPPMIGSKENATTVVNDLVAIANARKDCIVVASPNQAAVVTTGTTAAVIATTDMFTRSSYLTVDNNFLKVYDKYNDNYIKIPANSSTAGLMAGTDLVAAPWFSPAGQRRGVYLGITDIVLQPNKTDRDTLYKAGVNPVANIPGQGIMLFGDKTFMNRPSAFDRINVRRLFLAIERAIEIAGRNVMFEFNDEFTRAEFVNIVEPFLREIQGRRGITDFRVVCDDTNNTPAVVDRNEFIASIFVKPARSINYVTLNFVAVRSGVEFEEVAGTV
jgi:hypothetical protein